MLTVALFAVVVPIVITIAFMALRGRFTRLTADNRGIALQTIIIIVVLLAIAGAVATVLLTRAGEETDRIVDLDTQLDSGTRIGCEARGGNWTGDPPECTDLPDDD